MLIHHIEGNELVKEKPNTSEDFFNRSEASYEWNGEKHTFHLLYVRFFEEKLEAELTNDSFWKPYLQTFKIRDLAALAALAKNDKFIKRKRVYINDYDEFRNIFINPDENVLDQLIKPFI
ncbi:hypothetical protein [Bacillus sp. NEB1478]|uniref:hypothetical protein n=1 Tax=Bacillus sp. NEB1478 TaxID=3073816 RepID=UPI002872E64B|nr:hypothetical protein [Bacillus sp. NEB1478]WNB93672.1 hypothetical protein RGB74_08415 [Bacillus sp. NEB1478]